MRHNVAWPVFFTQCRTWKLTPVPCENTYEINMSSNYINPTIQFEPFIHNIQLHTSDVIHIMGLFFWLNTDQLVGQLVQMLSKMDTLIQMCCWQLTKLLQSISILLQHTCELEPSTSAEPIWAVCWKLVGKPIIVRSICLLFCHI